MCKAKWKSLRESYRKAINARKTKSGQAAKKIKPWRLEVQMEFIKPYLFSQSADQISNFSPPPESPESVSSPNELQMPEASPNNETSQDSIETPQILSTRNSRDKHLSSSKQIPPGSAAEVLRHYMNMKNTATETKSSGDHLSKYFQSIEETVRTLPHITQIRLKTQISQLVHAAELEAISGHVSSSPVSHCSSHFSNGPPDRHTMTSQTIYSTTNQNELLSRPNVNFQNLSESSHQNFSSPPQSNYAQYNDSYNIN